MSDSPGTRRQVRADVVRAPHAARDDIIGIDVPGVLLAIRPGFLKSDFAKGIALGMGLGSIAVRLAPTLRPVAKQAVKAGMLVLANGRIWAFEVRDSIEDLVSDVRAGNNPKPGSVSTTAAERSRPRDST